MLISEIYTLVISYIKTTLDDNSIKVFAANQSAARPLKPFVTVQLGGFQQVALAHKYTTNAQGVKNVILNKKFTVSLQAYTDELHRSEDILNVIHNGLFTQQAYDIFKGDIAYNSTLLGVTSAPVANGGVTESRAILELEFYTNQLVESNVGLIEHVYVHDDITNNDFIINRE